MDLYKFKEIMDESIEKLNEFVENHTDNSVEFDDGVPLYGENKNYTELILVTKEDYDEYDRLLDVRRINTKNYIKAFQNK